MRAPTLLSVTLLTLLTGLQQSGSAQQVFRSVDSQGNISYSDAPPADASQTQTIDLPPGPTEEQVEQAQQRTRELKESVDQLTSEREAREKVQAEKRREQQERERAQEQEARLARLEAMERNRDYWDYGVYYPRRPHRPVWIEHPIERPTERPDYRNPLPGLPPVRGLDGQPMFRQHR